MRPRSFDLLAADSWLLCNACHLLYSFGTRLICDKSESRGFPRRPSALSTVRHLDPLLKTSAGFCRRGLFFCLQAFFAHAIIIL